MHQRIRSLMVLTICLIAPLACRPGDPGPATGSDGRASTLNDKGDKPMPETTQLATFGNGCFWCTEAIYERVEGVVKVASGYMGGSVENPTYRQVCTGTTGHAEVVQVTYDPTKVSYERLLQVFFVSHDPTTLNRQGADRGTQYRSAIFPHSEAQRAAATAMIASLSAEKVFDDPIVTTVEDLAPFYKAEDYHQDYFALNPTQGYCQAVVKPKVLKFEKFLKEHPAPDPTAHD